MAGTLFKGVLLNKNIQHLRNGVKLFDKISCMSSTSTFVDQNKSDGVIKHKLNQLMQWYEEITGMDEVRSAQNRVLEAEERFIFTQDKRRESNKKVTVIQTKLKDLYAELDNTTRGEERYVQLITQEHKILKEEKLVVDEFQLYEKEEREHFSVLSSAVKESHEKERAQAEKTKYWSIIGSVIGTVIGIVGSSVNNELKMKELRRLVKESLAINRVDGISTNVPDVLSKHEKELSVIINEMKNAASMPGDHVIGRLNELIHTLDNKVIVHNDHKVSNNDEILDILGKQEAILEKNFKEITSILTSQYSYIYQLPHDQLLALPFNLEERLQSHHKQTQYILLGSTMALLVFPLILNYFGMM